MLTELNKVLSYINENYEDNAIIKPNILGYENNIYIAAKMYDLNIALEKPEKGHFLYGKCKYCLSFDYNANKKYRNELNWHGGCGSHEYIENDYSNIEEFLEEFCKKREYKQISLFN